MENHIHYSPCVVVRRRRLDDSASIRFGAGPSLIFFTREIGSVVIDIIARSRFPRADSYTDETKNNSTDAEFTFREFGRV